MNRGDAEERRKSGHRVIGSSDHLKAEGLFRALWRVFITGRAMLREIFDESAYARFLARHRMPSSGAAYAAFLHEKNGGRPRPRCC